MTVLQRIFSGLIMAASLASSVHATWTVATQNVPFTSSALSGGSSLFLASNSTTLSDAQKPYALSRAYIKTDVAAGNLTSFSYEAMTPEKASVNGGALDGDNPLYGKALFDLTIVNGAPLVRYDGTEVALVIKPNVILTNTQLLQDSNGANAGAAGVLATGPENYAFATVVRNGATTYTGTSGDGIALLKLTQIGLAPTQAAPLLDALIKVGGNGDIEGITALHWDAALSRLYVACKLKNVGGIGVVVGRVEGTKIVFEPIISGAGVLTNATAAWDSDDHVIATKSGSAVEIPFLTTMHASTNTSYLIAIGGTQGDRAVYALPLLRPAETSDGASSQNIGKLAQRTDVTLRAVEGKTAQIYKEEEAAAFVGGADAPDKITDMKVVGDTVFVSCAGSKTTEKGIFQSKALFNENGVICGWSAWTRVMGAANKVFGFAFDAFGRCWYHTGDGITNDTATLTDWGKSAQNGLLGGTTTDASVGLISQLNALFPSESGGISHLGVYSDENSNLSKMTMWVIGGNNTLAFARSELISGTIITSTTLTTGDATNAIHPFPSFADLNLGKITCSNVTSSLPVRIMVGGENGAAILRSVTSANDGGCWSADAISMTFSNDDYTFFPLGDFKNVRALGSDSTNGYVMTLDGLSTFTFDGDKFKKVPTEALGETVIATPEVLCGSKNHSFLGLQMVGDYAVLATTNGIYTQATGKKLSEVKNELATPYGWKQIYLDAAASPKVGYGVCSDMSFVPSSTASEGGTLYVLSADASLNVAILYRLSVSSNDLSQATIVPIATTTPLGTWNYMSILGEFAEHIYTDGAFLYNSTSFHHAFDRYGELTDVHPAQQVRSLVVNGNITHVGQWRAGKAIPLGVHDDAHTVGKVVRDHASGALLVPGVWGLKILQ